jgi:ABC-type nitrate/sulfonate/bicarbonate transport system ATPase subunit
VTPGPGASWTVAELRHAFGSDRPGEPVMEVLDGLSLRADAGEFVSVLGPSGCGKSTVLRVLAGLLVPEGGSADVGGASVLGRPGAATMQPQRDTLLPWKRTMDNAVLGAVVAGVPARQARESAARLWDRFGLTGYERAWPGELSGGMRQRLALLRAFLVPRPLILLDEPLGALDAITRRDLQVWLEQVWEADRRSVLLVTHDVDEAILLSDRVVVLSDRPARVVADIAVGLPRPRTAGLVADAGFAEHRAEVLDALERGHRRSA